MPYIDLEGWKHRDHFDHFRGFSRPFFSLTVEVDATAAWQQAQDGGPSFFVATLYAATQAANAVQALRMRVRGDRPWVHDRVAISSTVLRDDDTFGYARIEAVEPFSTFAAHAQASIETVKQGHGLSEPNSDDDVVYHSTVPWLRFTAFANAMSGADSIPRLVFGKCAPSGQRMTLPVALEVHHAVVHGLDVARFFEQLQAALDAR